MKDFLVKEVETDPRPNLTVKKRFRIGTIDDGRIKIIFEVENALPPHSWRHEGAVTLTDDDVFAYLNAAGVRI